MVRFLQLLSRNWHMGRHIPLRQIARRLQIRVRWYWLQRRRNCPAQASLRAEAARHINTTLPTKPVFLRLPCSETKLQVPVDWSPPVTDPASDARLAQQHYMNYLDQADALTTQQLIDDWIANNSPTGAGSQRYGWRAYNLSIRIDAWLRTLSRLGDQLDPSFIDRAHLSLHHQTCHLEQFLETDLRGNHLIKNIKALLHAGHYFETSDPLAQRWRQTGYALLARELDEQVLADGVHYERSPPYHCQVLGDLIDLRAFVDQAVLGRPLDEILERMAAALACLIHPDGLPAQFNDGGLTMSPAPEGLLTSLAQQASPNGGFALKDAGYFGWRSDDNYAVVDCGRLGPDYLIGHGHGDILAFEWSLAGKRIIVDQGTYQNLAGPRREISRATRQHNTVSIDQADQGDFYGAHRCGRRPKARLLDWQVTQNGCSLEGCHDGFARLAGRPIHRRRFDISQDQILITDHIETGQTEGMLDHRCVASLLLHPDCEVAIDGMQADVKNGSVHVRIVADAPFECEAAEWYRDLHVVQPTNRLRCIIPQQRSTLCLQLKRLS